MSSIATAAMTTVGSQHEALVAQPTITYPSLKDVRVHTFSLSACVQRRTELLGQLSAAEQERAQQIRNASRRIGFVASRALLREVLTDFTGNTVGRKQWVFDTGAFGKPQILVPDMPALHFTISYTTDLLVIAVSEKYELGVDIEAIPPQIDRTIPWQVLSSAERRALHSLPVDEQFVEFLRLWTLKEAYTKYFGFGVALDFRGIEIDLGPLQASAADMPRDARLADPVLHQQLLHIGGQDVVLALAAGRRRSE